MKRERKGKLFVLAGPSGVGKGTLRIKALSDVDSLTYSVSCTTRQPRAGERDGTDYHFVTEETFKDKLSRGMFLEHAVVHGDYYGTLLEDVERATDKGDDVLLEIDVQGARQVRKIMPDCVLIFVAPPSLEELENRLRNRKTESEEKIQVRLANAKKEMDLIQEYDKVIVNGNLEQACEDLRAFILNYMT